MRALIGEPRPAPIHYDRFFNNPMSRMTRPQDYGLAPGTFQPAAIAKPEQQPEPDEEAVLAVPLDLCDEIGGVF